MADPAANKRPGETAEPVKLESPLPQRRDRLTPERERRLLDLHIEHCPNCAFELALVEAVDVMVRMCEDCEGVWLDRKGLETLMGYPPEKRKAFVDGLFGKELDQSAEGASAPK